MFPWFFYPKRLVCFIPTKKPSNKTAIATEGTFFKCTKFRTSGWRNQPSCTVDASELRHPPVEGYGRHEIPLFPKVFYTFQVVGLGFLNHQQYQLERIPLRSQLPIGLGLPVAQKQLATPKIGSGDRHLKPTTVY